MRRDADRPAVPEDFRRLYDEHHRFVFRTLAHFGVAAAALDDALQDVFVVVHRRLHEYDRQRPVRSWLWGIARRVAATHQRSASRSDRKTEALAGEGGAPGTRPDEEVQARRAIAFVEGFVGALPGRLRDVFVLSEVEGFSAPEIADALDIKLGTVYSRLHEARGRFHQAVGEAFPDPDRAAGPRGGRA